MKDVKKAIDKKDFLVIKNNNLINARGKYKYNTNELKVVANLVSKILPTDTNLELKRVSIKDLGFVNADTNNHRYYDVMCNELLTKPFKIPGSHLWTNWFSVLGYKDGYIEYSFDERLKPFLLELKSNFTKYNLKNILKLKSSYSIHIYELLMQTKDLGGRSIFISDFRDILSIPKSYLNADIKRIINKAKLDLESHTDIRFEYNFEKDGRSFNKINFKIIHNTNQENLEINKNEEKKEYLDSLQKENITPKKSLIVDEESSLRSKILSQQGIVNNN